MRWIVIASFLCGTLAVFHGLYVAHKDLKGMEPPRRLGNALLSSAGELLRRVVQKNKAWLVCLMALMFVVLWFREWRMLLPYMAGIGASLLVGSLGVTVDAAVSSSDRDGPARPCRSSLLRGQVMMGCGLMSVAGIRLLVWLWNPDGRDPIVMVMVSFAFGIALMFMALRTAFPTVNPETMTHLHSCRTPWNKSLGVWDADFYQMYAITLAGATFVTGSLYGVDSFRVALPFLTGAIGLTACATGLWSVSGKRFLRLEPAKTMRIASVISLVLAGAGLYGAERYFQSLPMTQDHFQDAETCLFPIAFSGMVVTWAMVLIGDVFASKYPMNKEDVATAGNYLTTIRRVITAICSQTVPYAVGILGTFAGCYIFLDVNGSQPALYFGVAMSAMGIVAGAGFSFASDSEERLSAMGKFFAAATVIAAGVCLVCEYTLAVSGVADLSVTPPAKSMASHHLGYTIGQIIVYGLVGAIVTSIIANAIGLIREIISRYRRTR